MRFKFFMSLFCISIFLTSFLATGLKLCSPTNCGWKPQYEGCAYIRNPEECDGRKQFVVVTDKAALCHNSIFSRGSGNEVKKACIENSNGKEVCGNAETLSSEIDKKGLGHTKCYQTLGGGPV